MKVANYERMFLMLGGALLVMCLGALTYASVAMGMHLPGHAGTIDPADVMTTPPFDKPGVTQTGPASYDVVLTSQAWAFNPREVQVPVGADITFIATSMDVIHGFDIKGTRVNMMLIPGQIARYTYRFDKPGEYLLICHEYCGSAHHTMYGKVVVK